MIGHNRSEAAIAYLRNHSASKICENYKLCILICNLIESCLVKLPEEHRPVIQAAPFHSSADDCSRGQSIGIHMRDYEQVFFPSNFLGGAPAQLAQRPVLFCNLLAILILHVYFNSFCIVRLISAAQLVPSRRKLLGMLVIWG